MKMSKKSKVLALTLGATMLISAFAFSVSAADVTVGDVTYSLADGVYTVTVPYTAPAEVAQSTILATIGTETIALDPTDATKPINVAYIDQEANDGQFVFSFNESLVATNKDVFIKVGGTTVTAPGIKKITLGEPADEIELVNGTNATVTSPATVGIPGISQVNTITLDSSIPAGKIVKAYVDGVETGTVLFSSERNKYIVVLPTGVTGTVTYKAVTGTIDAANTISAYGDISKDTLINITDINMILKAVKTPAATPLTTDIRRIAADVNGDGQVNITDINIIIKKVKTPTFTIPITNN